MAEYIDRKRYMKDKYNCDLLMIEGVELVPLYQIIDKLEQSVSPDRIKQLREEIDKLADDSIVWGILANAEDSDIDAITERINECYRAMIFPLIDKLIAESEGKR